MDKAYKQSLKKFFKVDFFECESSNIDGYALDSWNKPNNPDLLVAFKGGKIYRYIGAGNQHFAGLHHADSKGKYVNANLVKGDFDIKKYEYK